MDPLLVSLVQRMRGEMEHILNLHPKIDIPTTRKGMYIYIYICTHIYI